MRALVELLKDKLDTLKRPGQFEIDDGSVAQSVKNVKVEVEKMFEKLHQSSWNSYKGVHAKVWGRLDKITKHVQDAFAKKLLSVRRGVADAVSTVMDGM